MKFPTIEEMARDVAEKALDEYEYNGKTLREWIEIILATDTNVGTKDGTNLAEVGTDCISKQQAIDALRGYLVEKRCPDDGTLTCRLIENEVINKLPSAEPKRGRWIKLDMHRGMADHKCTACEQECYVPTCMGEPMYAYCPNCGAKMEVNNEIN